MPRDGTQIGKAPSPTRRKRAEKATAAMECMPASASIVHGETHTRKQKAAVELTSSGCLPSASPIGNGSDAASGGGGQLRHDIHCGVAIAANVEQLVALQKRRQFAIKAKNQTERQIESLIASVMGFQIDATEKDRKAVFARAKAFRLAVEAGGEGHETGDTHKSGALSPIIPLVEASAATAKPWVSMRETTEKEIIRIAKELPVYDFALSVKGLGALGLGCLIAEAGAPLSNFATVSKLWKRMGLAVFDGKRQQKCRNKDEADRHGYSPRRRAEVWAFCSDSMFRQQWAGDKDADGKDPKKTGKPVAVPAHAKGPYGEVYGKRRIVTDQRIAATADMGQEDDDGEASGSPARWTKARCHNDARRIMTKALLRDLWRAWRGLPPRGAAPADA